MDLKHEVLPGSPEPCGARRPGTFRTEQDVERLLDKLPWMVFTDAEFNALVEDLVKSLDKFKVPAAEKNELLTALVGMTGDIVGQ